MDVKSLKGIAVVSIADGEKVGVIDDMLFDIGQRRLTVFRFARSTLFRGDRDLVRMSDVQSIGRDAIMIANKDVVRGDRDVRELKQLVNIKSLTSLRVVTQDGALVGNLATVQFDKSTGAITALEVSGQSIVSILRRNREIPIKDIVSIGSDVVVVPNWYGPETNDEADKDSAASSDEEPEPLELPEPRS